MKIPGMRNARYFPAALLYPLPGHCFPHPILCRLSQFFAVLSLSLFLSNRAEASLWEDYTYLYELRLQQAKEAEPWGASVLPPRGMWILQYTYGSSQFNDFYDRQGKRVPILAPTVSGLGGSLNMTFKGSGTAHILDLFCGLGRGWAFALQIPLATYEINVDMAYQPPTDPTSILTAGLIHILYGTEPFTDSLEGFWQTYELLGRPRPRFDAEDPGYSLADISAGFAWNYFRNKHFSFLATLKASFPTGRLAEKNYALYYGLGKDMDLGTGSLGFQLGHILDYRPPRPLDWIVLTTQCYYTLYLEQKRDFPTVFKPPAPFVTEILQCSGLDVRSYFPDLSKVDQEYRFTPGSRVKGVFQLTGMLFKILPLAAGFQATYFNAGEVKANSPEIAGLLNTFGLLGDAYLYEFWVGSGFALFPFNIPITISGGYNMPLGGKNIIIFEDTWKISLQFYSPWFFGEQIAFWKKK